MQAASAQLLTTALVTGASVALGVTALGRMLTRERAVAPRHRLPVTGSAGGSAASDTLEGEPLFAGLSRLPGVSTCLRGMQEELLTAGLGTTAAAVRFLAAQLGLAILLAAGGALWALSRAGEPAIGLALLCAVDGVVIGIYLPRVWLDAHRRQRLDAMQLTLPDVIDLLVVCIEAGMGLNAALLRVTAEMADMAPELCDELNRLNQEIRTGRARAEALRGLTRRVPVADLESVAGVLIQAERMGTSIGMPLRNQAHLLRTRRRQRAEERARQATVKLIVPLVFCIFPVILVVLLGPAIHDLLSAFNAYGGG